MQSVAHQEAPSKSDLPASPKRWQYRRWAWNQEEISSGAKMTLVLMTEYASDDGECWPSTATLARKRRVSRRTIFRHMVELRANGLISCADEPQKRADGGTTSNRYTLNIPPSYGQLTLETGKASRTQYGSSRSPYVAMSEPMCNDVIPPMTSDHTPSDIVSD